MSDVPFDDDDRYDDYEMGGGYADGKSSKAIADENSFPPLPTGRNDFVIKKIALKMDPNDTEEVLVTAYEAWTASEEGGEADTQESYSAKDIIVTWALATDDRLTVNEYFRAVPDDEDEARIFATSASKEGGKIGLDYNRLRHALAALGFDTDDGSIPVEAQRLGNWRRWEDGSPRVVSLDIQNQMDKDTNYKTPKLGANGQPFKQVKMFSHLKSKDTLKRLGLDTEGDKAAPAEKTGAKPGTRTAPAKTSAKPTTAPKTAPAPQTKRDRKF